MEWKITVENTICYNKTFKLNEKDSKQNIALESCLKLAVFSEVLKGGWKSLMHKQNLLRIGRSKNYLKGWN